MNDSILIQKPKRERSLNRNESMVLDIKTDQLKDELIGRWFVEGETIDAMLEWIVSEIAKDGIEILSNVKTATFASKIRKNACPNPKEMRLHYINWQSGRATEPLWVDAYYKSIVGDESKSIYLKVLDRARAMNNKRKNTTHSKNVPAEIVEKLEVTPTAKATQATEQTEQDDRPVTPTGVVKARTYADFQRILEETKHR